MTLLNYQTIAKEVNGNSCPCIANIDGQSILIEKGWDQSVGKFFQVTHWENNVPFTTRYYECEDKTQGPDDFYADLLAEQQEQM